MRYRVAAVGSLKRGFYADGCAHYLERLERLAPAEVIEVRAKTSDPARVQAVEGRALLDRTEGDYRILLDERGKAASTADWVRAIERLESDGRSRIAFLIGGADGHGPEVRTRSDESWSLSPLTLPHEMARLVVLEQLYRVETVRAGHPYHRSG